MIAENVQLDDNEFWDASSASCGGSTNDDLLSLNSEFLESLDGSSSSPAVQNKLTRFQTMSPGGELTRLETDENQVVVNLGRLYATGVYFHFVKPPFLLKNGLIEN